MTDQTPPTTLAEYFKGQLDAMGYGQPAPLAVDAEPSVRDQLAPDEQEPADTAGEDYAEDDRTGQDAGEYEPPTGDYFIETALEDPAAWEEATGEDPESWLRWALNASPGEWAQAAAAAGLPGAQQPHINSLPDDLRVVFEQEQLDARVARVAERGW